MRGEVERLLKERGSLKLPATGRGALTTGYFQGKQVVAADSILAFLEDMRICHGVTKRKILFAEWAVPLDLGFSRKCFCSGIELSRKISVVFSIPEHQQEGKMFSAELLRRSKCPERL